MPCVEILVGMGSSGGGGAKGRREGSSLSLLRDRKKERAREGVTA